MLNIYRYKLDGSSRKYLCPTCNKQRFVRYIDIETNEYLPAQYGRCDREAECAYHLNPYTDGYEKRVSGGDTINKMNHFNTVPWCKPKQKPITYIPVAVLKKTRQGWSQNIFLQNLLNRVPFPFSPSDIEKIIVQYQLGTVLKGYMAGAVTFPYIDEANNIRAIQVKQFDENNHTTSNTFLHSVIEQNLSETKRPVPEWLRLYNENESKVTCLFGAHLLPKHRDNPIALVEAPKSAIIGTLYYGFPVSPDRLLWLAVYNLTSLSLDKCRVLKGRTVILFPDLSKEGTAYQLWSEKAKVLEKQLPGTRFIICDLLEQKAGISAKSKGYDLADYLIQFNYRTFRNQNPVNPESPATIRKEPVLSAPPPVTSSIPDPTITKLNREDFFPTEKGGIKQSSPDAWDIQSLESFFSSTSLPTTPLRLNQCSIIHDLPQFISGHLAILHRNNGNPVFMTYLNRLQELKHILEYSSNIQECCSVSKK
jgi:hypothetical protein